MNKAVKLIIVSLMLLPLAGTTRSILPELACYESSSPSEWRRAGVSITTIAEVDDDFSATGTVLLEAEDQLFLDADPCNCSVQEFVAPYEKTELRTYECRGRTYPYYNVLKRGLTRSGDAIIDRVLERLDSLGADPQEDAVLDALDPLFERAAFRERSQSDWTEFLYVIVRTRLVIADVLMEHDAVLSMPASKALGGAVGWMIQVQNTLDPYLGEDFNLSAHIGSTYRRSSDFERGLPPERFPAELMMPMVEFYNDRLMELCEILDPIGLAPTGGMCD